MLCSRSSDVENISEEILNTLDGQMKIDLSVYSFDQEYKQRKYEM
jgi:hypothetical protein